MINNNLDLGVKTIIKLSIFLFIIAGNYVGDIYSCKLRHLFNEHMILKHILGFFIMLLYKQLSWVPRRHLRQNLVLKVMKKMRY